MDEKKIKAQTLVEVMNVINGSYSLSEAKKAINRLAIDALKELDKGRK